MTSQFYTTSNPTSITNNKTISIIITVTTSLRSLPSFGLVPFQVAGAKVDEEASTITAVNPTGVQLALMSGLLSTNAVLVSTPSVAKRIFGPHVGTLLSRYLPQVKLPRIFSKKRQAEQKDQKCKITGKVLKSDPG